MTLADQRFKVDLQPGPFGVTGNGSPNSCPGAKACCRYIKAHTEQAQASYWVVTAPARSYRMLKLLRAHARAVVPDADPCRSIVRCGNAYPDPRVLYRLTCSLLGQEIVDRIVNEFGKTSPLGQVYLPQHG